MPRKKDGMLVEFYPRPTTGEDGKPLLYVRPAMKMTWSLRYLDEWCNKYRGMSKGELTRALEVLLNVGTILMKDGARIETSLGTFGVKLKLDGDYSDPDKIKGRNISFAGIDFIPSKRFLQEMDDQITHGYRKYVDPAKKETLTEDKDRLALITRFVKRHGYITIRSFAYHSGIKYNTARKWLKEHSEGESSQLKAVREGHMLQYKLREKKEKKV